MSKLRKTFLQKNRKTKQWELVEPASKKVLKKFDTKAEATQRGVLKNALGDKGGSVKIRKQDGTIQEERTFPRSLDPKTSEG